MINYTYFVRKTNWNSLACAMKGNLFQFQACATRPREWIGTSCPRGINTAVVKYMWRTLRTEFITATPPGLAGPDSREITKSQVLDNS